ncbi:MAG: SpoIIE family protein phosphatase [Phycisphaerae bacterium]|nr:SpoIIE family protein phosphatase [Phycisphaerae bacterium]
MQFAAKRFIRWVLAIHLALLLVVGIVVILASRSVHEHARELGLEQAKATEELLAKQTSRGIENYYQAVTSVLELLKPTQEEEIAGGPRATPTEMALVPPPPNQPTAGPEHAPGERPNRGQEVANLRKRLIETLWKDVQQRVSLLFVLDFTPPRSHPGATTEPGELRLVPHDPFGEENGLTAQQVVAVMGDWFRHVEGTSLSQFERINGINCNVVVVPLRSMQNRRMLVAVVPIDRIENDLLANVNARAQTNAILFDDRGTIMSDTHADVVGKNVHAEHGTPRIRALADAYMSGGNGGTQVFERPEKIEGKIFPPMMITVEPIGFQQFSGTHWWIAIASELSAVDTVVNHIFGAAVVGAVFVVVSVVAILLSTGTQLIRARLKLERVQHEILDRELTQAREIQLNWLPTEACCGKPIDVAAVNRPANRISGDFYNWFDLPDGRTTVVIGDVTGHGMAAAFLMATTQLLVRSAMMRRSDPGKCLEEVNRLLCVQGFNGQFVTMSLLVLDTTNHTVEIATAGHPAPLLSDGDGFKKLEIEPEIVLGVDADAEFPTCRIVLPPDAHIVLYTDGVVDAATVGGNRFTLSGLVSSLAKGPFNTAQAMADAVTGAVDKFRGGHDLADDLTLVAIQLKPMTQVT